MVWSIWIAAIAQAHGQRVDLHPDPPGGLVAIAVQLAMVAATEWNGVFVADLAAERARLRPVLALTIGPSFAGTRSAG